MNITAERCRENEIVEEMEKAPERWNLGSCGRLRLIENFADAQHGGIGNGDAQGALTARLKKTVFEVNVLAGVARQCRGNADVDVGGAITHFYTFTD